MRKIDENMKIINTIIPNSETELLLLANHLDKLKIYEKYKGKWYIKSNDAYGKEKLVFDENKNQKRPEELVRQLFLYELIDNYGYPKDKIKIEEKVSFGREKKRADIVVYQEDGITPWILVEVKASHERLNIPQLKSYLNAEGSPIGVAINGKDITILYRPYPKEFDDNLPDIPSYTEYKEVKDTKNPAIEVADIVLSRKWTLEELEKKSKERKKSLREIIELLEELVLANSGVDSFNEIFKLIYSKLFDEWEAKIRKNKELKFRKYKDPQTTHKVISELFDGSKKRWKGIFEFTDKIKLTPEHLSVCVAEIESVKLFFADLRIIDEAFEYLVTKVSKGEKGQYFTPRVIIDVTVKMLNPHLDEYIIDPACGSAGFLIHSMQYVFDKYHIESDRDKIEFASTYLWGIDFDERTVKISKALMLIVGDGKTHIYKENSLEFTRWDKLKKDLKEEELVRDDKFKELNFDILMTNPPFAGDIKEEKLKSLYNIVPERKRKLDSKIDRHILFVERALDMIKPGGRLAIVLPQGIFNNTNDRYIREFIMKKARILAVIGLHGNSFKPHTGTKTSLLILKKWKEGELDEGGNPKIKDYPVFFGVSKIPFKDNSGNYIFSKDENGNLIFDEKGNAIYQTDLFDIADAFIDWGKKRQEAGDAAFDFLDDVKKKTATLHAVEYSIVNVSEFEGELRIDAEYYEPFWIENLVKPIKGKFWKTLVYFLKILYRYPSFYNINYQKDGVLVLKGEDIPTIGFIENKSANYIDTETSKKFHKTILRHRDLIMSVRGLVGKVGYITPDLEGSNINANLIRISLNNLKISPEYVWILLISEYGQLQIKRFLMKTNQETIVSSDIKSIVLPIPSSIFQKLIEKLVLKAYEKRKKAEELTKKQKIFY